MVDIEALTQFLSSGDFLGFIQAVYVAAFTNADVFYGVFALLLTSPLYIRTKSLLLLSIIWILLGSFFIVAMPIVSGLAYLLLVLGLGGMLFQLYLQLRG